VIGKLNRRLYMGRYFGKSLIILVLLSLLVALAVACGEDSTPAPAATAAAPVSTPTPAATPAPTPEPVVGPTGKFDAGYEELGFNKWFPPRMSFPHYNVYNSLPVMETWLATSPEGVIEPRLLQEWSVGADEVTWTFKFAEGVQFKGNGQDWGEFTAADALWTLQMVTRDDTLSEWAGQIEDNFLCETCSQRLVDKYTLEVVASGPKFNMVHTQLLPWGSIPVFSKTAFETLGSEDAMAAIGIGTAPWQWMEQIDGEFLRVEAVTDHWRQAPGFAEAVLHEIPEETVRVANFQTGALDTFQASIEAINAVKNMEGYHSIRSASGGDLLINMRGQFCVKFDADGNPDPDGESRPGYDPDLPWVSSNCDDSSPEWEIARKVRLAMALAIDRQLIVDTILQGEGVPSALTFWMGSEGKMGELANLKFDYDTARAKALLAEAGYPDGFDVEFCICAYPVPGANEGAEAVAGMWEKELNIKSKLSKVPYSTVRPDMLSRTLNGPQGHGHGAQPEPAGMYYNLNHSSRVWNTGIEHPYIDSQTTKIVNTADATKRMQYTRELGQWWFDNVANIPIARVNRVWPLSKEVGEWKQMLGGSGLYPFTIESAQPAK